MKEQNLLDRLESAKRRIAKLEAENNKLTNDNKSKNGLIANQNLRIKNLRFVLANYAEELPNGHDKIDIWQAIASDCKHL